MTRPLKHLDLFSGIGGFALGLRMAGGFDTVAFCEIDLYCQKVLGKNFPGVPIYDDVRDLNHDGPVDIITGGYPCQPYSLAGKRKGADDDRHLWPFMFSIIKKHRPTWVVGENVAGHINMGLDQTLADLESAGYAARAFVIPAIAVDAPHRRDRVWVVADAQSGGRGQGDKNHGGVPEGTGAAQERRGFADGGDALADPGGPGREEQYTPALAARAEHGAGRFIEVRTKARWPAEPGVGRVAHGVPRRVDRLKGLGNAVVPQIVEKIGRSIIDAHNQGIEQ